MEEYRRQGIATKLINRIKEIVEKEKDIRKITLFSGIERKSAHELYRKFGYNEDYIRHFIKL